MMPTLNNNDGVGRRDTEHRLATSKYYYWQKRLPINAATTPTFTQVASIATLSVPQLSATPMVCGLS
ncbi:MAG: hypothetical protein IPH58_17755 [Sphingobacteriales bacterium]|nr:hypothetical protein [Sphingobacteriales bacterium]